VAAGAHAGPREKFLGRALQATFIRFDQTQVEFHLKGGCDRGSMDEILNRDLKLAGIHTGNVNTVIFKRRRKGL
jgi:hypothetical protein